MSGDRTRRRVLASVGATIAGGAGGRLSVDDGKQADDPNTDSPTDRAEAGTETGSTPRTDEVEPTDAADADSHQCAASSLDPASYQAIAPRIDVKHGPLSLDLLTVRPATAFERIGDSDAYAQFQNEAVPDFPTVEPCDIELAMSTEKCRMIYGTFDSDTVVEAMGPNEKSYEAATRAAGAAVTAAEQAVDGGISDVPYALVRPSGHHAQPEEIDGYCYFNSVAVAVEQLQQTGLTDRVAVIDWDVHHGNGTQEIFYDRDDVLFVSLHADHRSWGEWHPQTGLPEEIGTGAGEGYNINIPLPHGSGDQNYVYAFRNIIEPIIADYSPDTIIVSAGQDPGLLDPLARNLVTMNGFEQLGSIVRSLAESHADGHLALVQEGGYQPSHLPYLTLGVLMGALNTETNVTDDPYDLWHDENLDNAVERIHECGSKFATYWPLTYESRPNR